MDLYKDIRGIRSAEACRAIADDLERLVAAYRLRAKDIENHRENSLAMDDKLPVIKAARLALIAVNKGACPAAACRSVSDDLWVEMDPVRRVFDTLHLAQTRDRRLARNRRIIKMRSNGAKIAEIARRFDLSEPQVSSITRTKKPPVKAAKVFQGM